MNGSSSLLVAFVALAPLIAWGRIAADPHL